MESILQSTGLASGVKRLIYLFSWMMGLQDDPETLGKAIESNRLTLKQISMFIHRFDAKHLRWRVPSAGVRTGVLPATRPSLDPYRFTAFAAYIRVREYVCRCTSAQCGCETGRSTERGLPVGPGTDSGASRVGGLWGKGTMDGLYTAVATV